MQPRLQSGRPDCRARFSLLRQGSLPYSFGPAAGRLPQRPRHRPKITFSPSEKQAASGPISGYEALSPYGCSCGRNGKRGRRFLPVPARQRSGTPSKKGKDGKGDVAEGTKEAGRLHEEAARPEVHDQPRHQRPSSRVQMLTRFQSGSEKRLPTPWPSAVIRLAEMRYFFTRMSFTASARSRARRALTSAPPSGEA